MTLFEYLAIASSIILSMGLIRLVAGLPAALTNRPFWIHLLWIFVKILSHALYWWTLWMAHENVEWNFVRFLYILLGPLILYAQAVALVPANPEDVASWREHFFGVSRFFFVANAIFLVHLSGLGTILHGLPLASMPLLAQVLVSFGIALSLAGASSTNPRLQGAVAILSAALILQAALGTAFNPIEVPTQSPF